jgi:hypothetical protein
MAANKTPIKRRGGRYDTELVVLLMGDIAPNDSSGQYIISSLGHVDYNTLIDVEFFGKVINGSGVGVNLGYVIGSVSQANQVTIQLSITDPVVMANSAVNFSYVKIRASFGLYASTVVTGTIDASRTTPSSTEAVSVTSNMLGRQQGFIGKPSNDFKLAVGINASGIGRAYSFLKISATRFARF